MATRGDKIMGLEETIRKFFFRKPKIELEGEGQENKPTVPEKVSVRCEKCKTLLLSQEFAGNLYVCPKCGFHHKMGARERLINLADGQEFVELFSEEKSENTLGFPSYDDKLAKAKEESGENDGVVSGILQLSGITAAVFAMDYRFMMGSMGHVSGEKITKTFEYASAHRYPVIGFVLSGGARMQEGIISLMQMAKTSGAVGRHSQLNLLYIPVLTNPTTGGVSASFALLGDIIVAEPGALIGFAGPRVIEQTTRQKLPAGFQTAEFVQQKGFVDVIIPRGEMKEKLAKLLKYHAKPTENEGGKKA